MKKMTMEDLRKRITYHQEGDFMVPDIGLPEEEEDEPELRKYGMMRKKYLEENQFLLYERMAMNGTLFPEMRKVDEAADQIKKQMLPKLAQEAGGESPAASFMPKNEIPESEVVRVLQSGSGIENGKIRIAALFLSESDAKKRVDFLKEEYGTGGRTHYFEDGTHGWVDWDAKGILISKSYSSDAARLRLPWTQVEKRLGELIRNDQYLESDEKEELSNIENKYGTLPLPMVRFEYPYEDRTPEPTEIGLADDLLTVRETEDGYVVWDSMQEGIHTEPDGTIGGPYADKAQAQLHKYEFEKKILERSEQNKSHVLSEQEETQAAPEKEGVSESDTQKAVVSEKIVEVSCKYFDIPIY